ncbi:MAG: NYN domain-containing protein [Ignavibacterium sp.]|nr:NYN domain-containing protein [Ignavibacterium sp.]
MIHYIIDGNNLIGKIVSLKNLPDKQSAREKLSLMLERFFAGKKLKVSLHFDGYENEPIRISGIKIKYSLNRSADEIIKEEIEKIKNQKSVFVVSSDLEILSYAKVCGCNVLKSEEFYHQMLIQDNKNKEDEKPSDFDTDEFKKLFGIE